LPGTDPYRDREWGWGWKWYWKPGEWWRCTAGEETNPYSSPLSAAIAVSTTPTRWQQDDRDGDGDGDMGVERGPLYTKQYIV